MKAVTKRSADTNHSNNGPYADPLEQFVAIARLARKGVINIPAGAVDAELAGMKRAQGQKREREEMQGRKEARRRGLAGAREVLREAIADLADTRDLIGNLAKGDDGGFCHESVARFAGLSLCDAAKQIEQALCDLGLIEEDDLGGYFHDGGKLKRQVPTIQNERGA